MKGDRSSWRKRIRSLLPALIFTNSAFSQTDVWDLPPLHYSDATAVDAIAKLETSWRKEEKPLAATTELQRVHQVLSLLKVPTSSQILVFSKTSKQNELIWPSNPRAIYFSPNCYVGFVPGGVMEAIVQDPHLGPVFYLINTGDAQRAPRAERDTSDCLSCHATGRTENVPGMLVRSVYPDQSGNPLLSLGSTLVDHTTPIAQRWGGYYVTGTSRLPHLGNHFYREDQATTPVMENLTDLSKKIDTTKYPQPTSDIVALLVLEHQCKAHNLLNAASLNYKRAFYLAKALNPNAAPDEGSAGRIAELAAHQIAEWFLFKDEAELGEDGVSGSPLFEKEFFADIPKCADGSSLADFHLQSRLFKNRCSYMIYSDAFAQLPTTVKQCTLKKIEEILRATDAPKGFEYLKNSERQRILKILRETKVLS